MRTLNNNIIIKPLKEKEGVIYVSDTKKPSKGVVQTKGKLVKKGDKVAYKQWSGSEIDDIVVVKEEDILFIYG